MALRSLYCIYHQVVRASLAAKPQDRFLVGPRTMDGTWQWLCWVRGNLFRFIFFETYIFGSGVVNLYKHYMHYVEAESMKSIPHDTTVLCFGMRIWESYSLPYEEICSDLFSLKCIFSAVTLSVCTSILCTMQKQSQWKVYLNYEEMLLAI